MSELMAEKKKEEIEALENQTNTDKKRIEGDACPVCGQKPTSYPYICFLPSPYGWLECVSCGTIFCPRSLRSQKIEAKKHMIEKPEIVVTE